MRRRVFLGLAAGLGAAAAAGACGVPSQSDPIRLGDAPTKGPGELDVKAPPLPMDARNQTNLVQYYFDAAAGANTTGGDRPDALKQARDRLTEFFTTDGRATSVPRSDKLLVVRIPTDLHVSAVGSSWTVEVPCVPLGLLDSYGDLSPVPNTAFTVTFTVVSTGNDQWRIAGIVYDSAAPSDLLLRDTGLGQLYEAVPTYFWDSDDGNVLVPELRYLTKAIAEAKRPAERVRWLSAGPSDWLRTTLQALPQEAEVKEAPWDMAAQRLVLNLSSKASGLTDDAKRKLAIQVWWTLRRGTVALSVEGTSLGIEVDLRSAMQANAAARGDDASLQEKFCVVDHKVRAAEGTATVMLSPSGNPSPNTDVVFAAMTRLKHNGAFVRQEGNRKRLWIGSLSGGSGDKQYATWEKTNVVGTELSRPVWIGRPQRMVLVIVDGRLMTVVPGPNAWGVPVGPLRPGLGPITAVAVAPDGRRIALIANGQPLVAAMTFGDNNAVGITDQVRPIYTPLASNRAIGWGDEQSLVIGGAPTAGNSDSLLQVPISSAGQVSRTAQSYIVDQVSCFPVNATPGTPNNGPLIMIQSNGQGFDVFFDRVAQLALGDATPSAPPSGGPPPPLLASAPFFLDLV